MSENLTKRIIIDNVAYEITLLDGFEAGIVGITLMQKIAPMLSSIASSDIYALNQEIRNAFTPSEFMALTEKLINPNLLKVNDELVVNWKTHFAGKPLLIYRLGAEALRANCEDFFTSISGFLKEKVGKVDLAEVILKLNENGITLPLEIVQAFQTGSQKTEKKPHKKR